MNQQFDHFVTYEFLDLSLPGIPPRSRLYHLEPRGMGTPYVESLTSYMARLAQTHSVSVRSLIVGALTPILKRKYLGYGGSDNVSLNAFWKEHSRALIGTGKLAQDFARALEIITLCKDLTALTLVPWANVFATSKLYRSKKAWCPECLNGWQIKEENIYEPLLWQLYAVTICPRHQMPLIDQCPYEDCHLTMPQLKGNQTHVGYCVYCSRWLGHRSHSQCNTFNMEEQLWNNYASEVAGKLLENNLNLKDIIHLNNVPILIDAYLEQVAHNNKNEMARNVNISPRALTSWQQGKSIPQFHLLMRLCYCSGVSLFDLVTLPLKIFQSVEIKFHSLPESFYQLQKPRKAIRIDPIKLRQQLEEILESREGPPLSMYAVGRLLGRDKNTIRDYYPEICKEISRKYLDFCREEAKKRHQKMRRKIGKAILKINSKGIYPSFNKVVDHLGKDFSLDHLIFRTYWHEGLEELKKRKA